MEQSEHNKTKNGHPTAALVDLLPLPTRPFILNKFMPLSGVVLIVKNRLFPL